MYLEKCGWKYTCETPGCFWLWQRALDDGRTVLTDRETAVRIAATMNEPDEPGDVPRPPGFRPYA